MSESSINLWSWFTGAIGIATVLPLLYTLVVAQLPVSKIKVLEEALGDTRDLLESVIEKSLISNNHFIEESRMNLVVIEERAEKLKLSAYGAQTTFQQLKGMVLGLSLGIHRLYRRVHCLRAKISETTSKAQERLEREARVRSPSDSDATQSTPLTVAMSESSRDSVDIADLRDPHLRLTELPYRDRCAHSAFSRLEDAKSPLAPGTSISSKGRLVTSY